MAKTASSGQAQAETVIVPTEATTDVQATGVSTVETGGTQDARIEMLTHASISGKAATIASLLMRRNLVRDRNRYQDSIAAYQVLAKASGNEYLSPITELRTQMQAAQDALIDHEIDVDDMDSILEAKRLKTAFAEAKSAYDKQEEYDNYFAKSRASLKEGQEESKRVSTLLETHLEELSDMIETGEFLTPEQRKAVDAAKLDRDGVKRAHGNKPLRSLSSVNEEQSKAAKEAAKKAATSQTEEDKPEGEDKADGDQTETEQTEQTEDTTE